MKNKNYINNVNTASYILSILNSIGYDFEKDRETDPSVAKALEIIDESASKHDGLADRQECFLIAVELVGEPNTSRKRAIVANAYEGCHVEYTLYAIKATKDFIDKDHRWVMRSKVSSWKPGFTKRMLRKERMANWYYSLGKLYERCYDFDKAIECYEQGGKFDTWSHFSYLYVSQAYIKKNNLDAAIQILMNAKHHPNYLGDTERNYFSSSVIDNYLKDAIEKKARGYVYKPRGHREFLIPPKK